MFDPMKNRAMKVTFIKETPQTEGELETPSVDFEKIEKIARKSVLDLTKLAVAAVGSLMILHTALEIVEDKATSKD